jgi:hypothetical protein
MNNLKLISVISSGDNEYKPIHDNFLANISSFNSIISSVKIITVNTKSGDWQSQGFLDTVYKKLDCTHQLLEQGYTVFCTDLDIFYLNDPIEYMYELLNDFDIVGQNDFDRLCTGFYMVKPSCLTIDLFDTSEKLVLDGEQGDQNYIHTKLQLDKYSNLKTHKLDRNNFPNGYRWYKWHKKLNPSIVHYNSISSIKGKIDKMKQFNHWLV